MHIQNQIITSKIIFEETLKKTLYITVLSLDMFNDKSFIINA